MPSNAHFRDTSSFFVLQNQSPEIIPLPVSIVTALPHTPQQQPFNLKREKRLSDREWIKRPEALCKHGWDPYSQLKVWPPRERPSGEVRLKIKLIAYECGAWRRWILPNCNRPAFKVKLLSDVSPFFEF